jgi:NADH:quinone reductase (non-electrogenic)
MPNRTQRVLIAGGGHAGVRAAQRLLDGRRPADRLEVAMASPENVELWHGLMPQVLSGTLQPQHVMVPLREVVPGLALYNYEVRELDLDKGRALLTRGVEGDEVHLDFDYLVLAVGSVPNLARFPGMMEHAVPTKTIGDFLYLRSHIIGMLETAAERPSPEERRQLLTFVVAGAGFAAVEIAAGAADLIRSSLRLYPRIDAGEVRIICVDPVPRVLPTLNEDLARRVERYLRKSGVELKLGVSVTSCTSAGATLSDGQSIAARTVIATAGTGPNPLVASLDVHKVGGRVACDEHCRVRGRERIFATGDVAAVIDPRTGRPYPQMVTFAISQGECAADNILAAVRGEPPVPYQHTGLGQVAVLSRTYGVAQVKGRSLDGRLAALAGRLVFLSYMPSWRRRVLLALDWTSTRLLGTDVPRFGVSRSSAVQGMRFNAGDTIVGHGELGNYFYVITEGEAEVVERDSADDRLLRRLGRGDYFGELALLGEGRRTATVRAVSDTRVIAINRHDFGALVAAMPALLAQVPWRDDDA